MSEPKMKGITAPTIRDIQAHNPKNKIKESKGYRVFTVVNAIIMILVSFATLYPFLYLISQSFTSEQAIIAGHTSLIPEGFNINTYIYVITRYDCEFLKYYLNTIIYTLVGTVLSLLFSSILAYPLSKPQLKINRFLSPFIIFTMYFGGGLIANYVLVLKLGLKNSMWGFILPMLISTYYVILMRSFFMSIPKDLEEAGEIDGLNKFGVFWHIARPLSTPIIATIGSMQNSTFRINQSGLLHTSSRRSSEAAEHPILMPSRCLRTSSHAQWYSRFSRSSAYIRSFRNSMSRA